MLAFKIQELRASPLPIKKAQVWLAVKKTLQTDRSKRPQSVVLEGISVSENHLRRSRSRPLSYRIKVSQEMMDWEIIQQEL